VDAFSEVLRGVKLKGAVFFSAEFSWPWSFVSPALERFTRRRRRSLTPAFSRSG
jgi:hypothetical protein